LRGDNLFAIPADAIGGFMVQAKNNGDSLCQRLE
jgi:hypothetical protein